MKKIYIKFALNLHLMQNLTTRSGFSSQIHAKLRTRTKDHIKYAFSRKGVASGCSENEL